MAESIGFASLAFALAALGSDGSGGGGGEGGTVSVRINEVFTIEPDEPARVENIGDSQTVVLNLYLPKGQPGVQGQPGADGKDGLNGNMIYVSTEKPGTPVYNMVNNDIVVYGDGSLYQMIAGELKNTGVNIRGSEWIIINTPPSTIVPVDASEGDVLVYNTGEVFRITGGRLVNTGLNLKGADGQSPTIEVSEDTEDTYKLQITDINGTFETPNLKGSGSSTSSFDLYAYAQSIGYEYDEDTFKQAFLKALNFFSVSQSVVDGNASNSDPTLDGGIGDEKLDMGVDTGDAELTFPRN